MTTLKYKTALRCY